MEDQNPQEDPAFLAVEDLLNELLGKINSTTMPMRSREHLSGYVEGCMERWQMRPITADVLKRHRLQQAAVRAERILRTNNMTLQEQESKIVELFREAGLSKKLLPAPVEKKISS